MIADPQNASDYQYKPFNLDDELCMCAYLHQRETYDRASETELEARILGEPPDYTPAPPLNVEWRQYYRTALGIAPKPGDTG